MLNACQIGEDLFQATAQITVVTADDLHQLKRAAAAATKRRARLCAHHDGEALLHDMVIALAGDTYVRPHNHLSRPESFHIIEGLARLVFFDEHGDVTSVIPIGPVGSGRCFFCRIEPGRFHTVIPEDDWLVVHESTLGPFNPEGTDQAPWAPAETDSDTAKAYWAALACHTESCTFPADKELSK